MQASSRDRFEKPLLQRLFSGNSFLLHIVFILCIYFFCVAIVGFAGDFELNDGWIYAHLVQQYLNTGRLELTGSYVTCYLPTVFGAVACKLMGFSHHTLRCLSLLWGFAFIATFWLCLREINVKAKEATFCALVLFFNPLLFYLSFAFMTD